jgi:hypothetical protein
VKKLILCIVLVACGDVDSPVSPIHGSGWIEPDYCETYDLDNRCFGGDLDQQCYWSALYYNRGTGSELIDDEYVCDKEDSSGRGYCLKEFKEYCFWILEEGR